MSVDISAGAASGSPRIILITGAPGSGKSTLGVALAGALRAPFLARDDVRGGLFLTAGSWTERPERVPAADEATETFLRLVETTARLGVSCVVELLVRTGRPQDLERLMAVGTCTVITTWCRDPLARFAARHDADRLLNRRAVLDVLGYDRIEQHTSAAVERVRAAALEMRTDFDLPVLPVNTDDGYDPGLDRIVELVTDTASPGRRSRP